MRLRVLCIVSLTVSCLCSSLIAETEIDISGQVRVRNHWDKRDFVPGSEALDYNYLRARLGVKAIVDSNSFAFIQFQDSRTFEEDSLVGAMSGTRSNTKNLDVHQAYLEVRQLFFRGVGLNAGRFEMTHGNERIFGADDWHNVGLAFNGVMLSYENPDFRTSLFGLSGPMERRSEYDYTSLLWGGTLRFPSPMVDMLYFHENVDFNNPNDTTRINRHTIALYGKQTFFSTSLEWNAAYQFGENKYDYVSWSNFDYRISAYLVTVELSRRFGIERGLEAGVGIDYASGDNPATERLEGFVNHYYSFHEFRGYMDYFTEGTNPYSDGSGSGLMDLYIKSVVRPVQMWAVELAIHRFVLPHRREYFMWGFIPGPIRISREIGWEGDMIIGTTQVKGVKLEGGLSFFFAHESFTMLRDFDPGYYLYSQMTVDF